VRARPTATTLVYEFVGADREYTSEPREERWDWCAERLLKRFGG
jgi:hypothetical protein